MADVYRHTSEYGETFLAVSSTKINNEGIKMIGRSITNFFTETTVSKLDELYRGKWQNCFAGTAVEGDSHLQWAGLVSHMYTLLTQHIFTRGCFLSASYGYHILAKRAIHLHPSLPFPRSRQVSLHSNF